MNFHCRTQPTLRACLVAALLHASVTAQAEVRRRIVVRSNPPGALVYIDDQQIGFTPASTSFIYYGTRKIQLVKDGYKTLTVKHTFSPPWYEIPPVDFFSENLYPGELRDERVLDFQLEPETIPPTNELVERAEALRAGARAGVMAPPVGAMAPPTAFPAVQPAPAPVIGEPLPAFRPPVETIPAPAPLRLPPIAPSMQPPPRFP